LLQDHQGAIATSVAQSAPLAEQRLVLRILTLWRAAHIGETLPQPAAMTVAATGDDAHNVYLLEIGAAEEARFAYIGETLLPRPWRGVEASRSVADCPRDTILGLASTHWHEIVERRVPVTRGGIGWHNAAPVLYRAIMVPLFDAGGTISAIMGAVNWRPVEVQDGTPVD